jgi:hypothetical protein
VNDTTVQIFLIILILWKLHSVLIDVETSFLLGILKGGEEIFMDCLEGMECEDDECVMLEKAIYGLVQTA